MSDPLDEIGWGVYEDDEGYVHVIPVVQCEPDVDEEGWTLMPPHKVTINCSCHPNDPDEGVVTHNMIH